MDDLISRQAAMDEMSKQQTYKMFVGEDTVYLDANDVGSVLASLPSIDAVQVIRCKDCKWYGRADKRRFYRGADCLQKRIDTIVPERDFCSRAERKEE